MDLYDLLMHWDVLVVLFLLVPLLCSNMLVMMPVCTFCAQHTCGGAADGRHGHADRSPAALPPAQRPHQCNQQTGETNGTGVENNLNGQHEEQKGKQEDDEQECGLSLDQLGHESVGSQQALRNEDEQNKFVAGIIRRGLHKEGWKLVITGAPALIFTRRFRMQLYCWLQCCLCLVLAAKTIEAYFSFDANHPIAIPCAHCCMLIQWICATTRIIQVGLWAFTVSELLQGMFGYTGHSLGAGVAALLSLKMHERAQGVKCWAFCPPGGLLSQNLSHAAEDYCTSIIVNKDMVPRLSLKTVYRLFEGMSFGLSCHR